MASREEVYVEFGRAAEVAQLLETEIGTALLALDALETKSFISPNADAYTRLRDAIDGKTLGAAIKQMGKFIELENDLGAVLSRALESRNLLTHRFYRNTASRSSKTLAVPRWPSTCEKFISSFRRPT